MGDACQASRLNGNKNSQCFVVRLNSVTEQIEKIATGSKYPLSAKSQSENLGKRLVCSIPDEKGLFELELQLKVFANGNTYKVGVCDSTDSQNWMMQQIGISVPPLRYGMQSTKNALQR